MRSFEEYKEQYPDWSDDQIWTAISIEMEAEKAINEGGTDVNIDDPDVWNRIIRGAGEWLQVALPKIFEKVKQWFSSLMSRIGNWAKEYLNVDSILNWLSSLWD